MTKRKIDPDWRVHAFPIQVRVYPDIANRKKWSLYSRHRNWGTAANRAYIEAVNAHPGCLVELVDLREQDK